MKLDKHIVDMFTELTKPADDVKMEKTCYGTISVVDGTRYVKLDGSDLLVPAASTVKTSHGDRVTVLMKNHSLTITGNLTAPATDGEGGSSGEAGTAATIKVGMVTTGEAGSSATVTNSGTTSAAVFDFVIPRGEKGEKGEKGDAGPQGPQGEKGDTGTWDGTIPDHEHTVSDITDFPTSLPANGGTASKAYTLSTARTIDGVSFNGSANIAHYASCSTAAATAAKVVSLTGFTLATGAKIAVKFTVTNTAANPTLNVNGTGAKAIYYRGAAVSAKYLAANRTYEFVYNGTQYELIGDLDTNTDTKVTAVGNHYIPSGGATTSASGGTLTDITNSSSGVQVVTGVTKDAAGHVTGVTSVALKSTKVTVDSSLSTSSTNPVQNKIITTALNAKANSSDIPTSLPANGGNADTLDGFHASDIRIDSVSDTAELVTLDSLQGGVPFSEISVSGKNLIDLSRRASSSVVQADGDSSALTISYSMGSEAKWVAASYTVFVKKNTRYYLTCTAETANGFTGLSVLQSDLSPFSPGVYKWGGNEFSLSFDSGDNEFVIIKPYANASHTGLAEASVTYHNIMLSESENAEYVPEIIGQNITLSACGKNLIPYPYTITTKTVNGVTFTDNGDGTITINGTATDNIWVTITNRFKIPKNINYTFSCGEAVTGGNTLVAGDGFIAYMSILKNVDDTSVSQYVFPLIGSSNATFAANAGYAAVTIRISRESVIDNIVIKPQLEVGELATEYEPYSGTTTIVTPDTNPYTVPNDIRQQDGINNVSVSAGEVTVTGAKKNAALKTVWDKLDELTAAIIVSNGETT